MKWKYILALTFSITTFNQPIWAEATAKIDSTHETWALVQDLLFLQDQSVQGLNRKLPKRILDLTGFEIECQHGFLRKLSEIKCARGLRAFSKALYSSQFSKDKDNHAVLKIIISDIKSPSTEDAEKLLLRLPYDMLPNQMADFVTAEMLSASYRKRAFLRSQFQDGLTNLQANLPIPIHFDESLSSIERWTALMSLTALAKENLRLFEGPEESLFVTHQFQPAHEEKMNLQLDIKAAASLVDLKQALREPSLNLESLTRLAKLKKERLVQEQLTKLLANDGVTVRCSQMGHLFLNDCLTGLHTLASMTDGDLRIVPRWPPLLIVSSDESPDRFKLITNYRTLRSLLIIRNDFSANGLIDFLKQEGWAK